MKAEKVDIVPETVECYAVYDTGESVIVDDRVIAWRIETNYNTGEYNSTPYPITVNGDILEGCIGIQNPDKTITVFESSNYKSLKELNKERYPDK